MKKVLDYCKKNQEIVLLVVAVAIGSIVSWILNSSRSGDLNPRESLSILMSNDIANGNFMAMRPGHPSMGAIEQYIGAPFTFLFSSSTIVTIAPRVLLFLASAHILWWFFVRTNHLREMRVLSAVLWVSVFLGLFFGHVFYGSQMFVLFAFIACLVSAYFAAHSLRNARFFFLWAFVSGLALWASIFSLVFIIPTAIWIIYSARALTKKIPLALLAFIFGSLPWWVFNITNSFVSLRTTRNDFAQRIPESEKFQSLDPLRIIGVSPFIGDSWQSTFWSWVFIGLAVGALTILAVFFVLGLRNILKLKRQYSSFTYLIVFIISLAAVLEVIFFVITSNPGFLSFAPVLLCFGFLCVYSRLVWQNYVLIFCVAILSVGAFINSVDQPALERDQRTQLIAELENNNVKNVFAPYEFAYSIEVASDSSITSAPFDEGFYEQTRQQKVSAKPDALIIRKDSQQEILLSLCVEGFFAQGFGKTQLQDLEILLIPEEFKSNAGNIIARCRVVTKNFLDLR